eukprot:6192457-Pleurochrysis_carterae.AAC.1
MGCSLKAKRLGCVQHPCLLLPLLHASLVRTLPQHLLQTTASSGRRSKKGSARGPDSTEITPELMPPSARVGTSKRVPTPTVSFAPDTILRLLQLHCCPRLRLAHLHGHADFPACRRRAADGR